MITRDVWREIAFAALDKLGGHLEIQQLAWEDDMAVTIDRDRAIRIDRHPDGHITVQLEKKPAATDKGNRGR